MKNDQKGFANLILIGVVVVLLVLVGYFVWLKNSEPITDVGRPLLTQKNEIENWKTYTNALYGFKFQYPSDYQIFENTIFDVKDKISKLQVTVEKNPTSEPLHFFELNVKGGGETLNSTVGWYKKNFDNVVVEQNKINDNDFSVVGYDLKPESDGFPHHYETVFIEHKGFVYIFDYSSDFKDILSTFKFTNSQTGNEPTKETVLRLLKINDGCPSGGIAGEYVSCKVDMIKEGNNWNVTVTYSGLYDDSVNAGQTKATIINQNGQWVVNGNISNGQSCAKGRGHQDFSSAPCL